MGVRRHTDTGKVAMSASDIQSHLIVETSRTITGALHDGATIRNGAQLTVLGAATGEFHVATASVLMVQGNFDGTITGNDGTVLLYGRVGLDPDDIIGNVAVGVDSLVATRHGDFRLLPDGELEELTASVYPVGSFKIQTNDVCCFDVEARSFRPLGGRS